MIEQIEPLAVGNAVQIAVLPPDTSVRWRVLRNTTGIFPAFDDPASILIRDVSATDPRQFIDYSDLVNGTLYYYQDFSFDGSAWSSNSNPVGVTPATTYQDDSVDALTIVLARVQAGIDAEVTRGALKPTDGKIAVLSAPPVFEDTRFPVVSIHLQSEAPINRALGEEIAHDELNLEGLFDEHEGWVAKTQLQIVGWSLNADERIDLRKAIRRIILANLAVFEDAVLMQVEFSQQDIEDFTTYNANVYETVGTFSCMTPLSVNVQRGIVADVVSTVTPIDVEVTL